MAFSLNKVMLIGNLGKDSETRFVGENSFSVTNFSIATTRSYKNKEGNWADETTWHNVVAYNLSDFYKDNLKKGKKFYVEGRLSKRDYTDKDGVKRYTVEVVSEQLIPLESSGSRSTEGQHAEPSTSDQGVAEDDLPF